MAPLKFTVLLVSVALKLAPLMVTSVPALPDAGEKESIEGVGPGSWLFLHPEKNKTKGISRKNRKYFMVREYGVIMYNNVEFNYVTAILSKPDFLSPSYRFSG